MNIYNDEFMNLLNITRKYVDLPMFSEDYNLEIEHSHEKGYKISKVGNNIHISYNKKNEIFAALFQINAVNKENYMYSLVNNFDNLGITIDFARNGVLNIEYVKKTIVQLALIGYDTFVLYLEDCFEVENEKMFGYMRGAYTEEQLKEIDDFARLFGIEVIPSIQTLAHMNQIFRWNEYKAINDIDDILLIKNERTYQLIENMIRTLKRCFSSNKIHIGMDEAHNLGKGKYLDENGYTAPYDLFIEHKNLVIELCEKYEIKPLMWSDMFFRSINKDKYYVDDEKLDFNGLKVENASLVYWDYYHNDYHSYEKMINLHKEIGDDIIFAGAIWLWRGLVPHLKYTETTMLPAIKACKNNNIKKIIFTTWGDDGNESLRGNAIGSYIFLLEHLHNSNPNKTIINNKCKALTGYTYNEWLNLDRPNFIDINDAAKYNVNPSKYLLYMDPLLSVFDNLICPKYDEIYRKTALKLHNLARRNEEYSYLFELESKLCKVLSYKATLNLKIKEAYDSKDIESMEACLWIVNKTIVSLKDFYNYYRLAWSKENKMIGFEIQDVRLGGCISRLEYIKLLLKKYISGENRYIEELEIERKEFICGYKTKNNETLIANYAAMVSTNRLSW